MSNQYNIPQYNLSVNNAKCVNLGAKIRDIKLEALRTWFSRYARKDSDVALKYFKKNGYVAYKFKGKILNMELFPMIVIDGYVNKHVDEYDDYSKGEEEYTDIENVRLDDIVYRSGMGDMGAWLSGIPSVSAKDYDVVEYMLEVNGDYASDTTELKDILLLNHVNDIIEEQVELKREIEKEENDKYIEWFRGVLTDVGYYFPDTVFEYMAKFKTCGRLGKTLLEDVHNIKPIWDKGIVLSSVFDKYDEMSFRNLFRHYGSIEEINLIMGGSNHESVYR